jgi:hemerythrin-like domain-containing protein
VKRSPELTPLSHEHHQALVVAMALKRAEGPEAAAALVDFHRSDGERHFEIEERILLPGWLAADPGADHAAAARVLGDHLELRAAVRRLQAGEPTVAELHRLGALLETHVRFEERELFPAIEAALDEGVLAELGAAIAAAERS